MSNEQQSKKVLTKIGRDCFLDGEKLPDVLEVKKLCYDTLRASKRMPKDAKIKNTLKGGGVIRYKRDRDMLTIGVSCIFTTERERRKEIEIIARKVLAKIIKENPHIYICFNQ